MPRASRTLIIAPAWVGDAVMSAPLIAALAERGEEVHVCAHQSVRAIYDVMPGVAGIIDNPFAHGQLALLKRRALGKAIGKLGFSTAYVLPNSLKSALLPYFAGIKRRVGYRGEQRFLLLNDQRQPNKARDQRLIQKNLALAASPKDYQQQIATPLVPPKLMSEHHAQAGSKKAALCPGAEYGPAKQWPAEHFAALANELLGRGYEVHLLGGPKDREIANRIAGICPQVINHVGHTTLAQAISLLGQMRYAVANDSGLLHVADALGVPTTGLFGSTTPTYSAPAGPKAKTIYLGLGCSPCHARNCPEKHHDCMRHIHPSHVLEHVDKVI